VIGTSGGEVVVELMFWSRGWGLSE